MQAFVAIYFRILKNNKLLKIRNPNHTRPWQYILDCLDGYLTLASLALKKDIKANGSWNFGPPFKNIHDVKSLVNEASKYFSKTKTQFKQNSLDEKKFLSLSILKSKKQLKWVPKLNFENTVKFSIQDYNIKNLTSKET